MRNLNIAIDILRDLGYKVIPPPDEGKTHWLIMSQYLDGEFIGCTSDRLSVLHEEPGITFVIVEGLCPNCNEVIGAT